MDFSGLRSPKKMPVGPDNDAEEEYASQSKLLQEFTNISMIDRAWAFESTSGSGSHVMFLTSQPNPLANKMRKYISSCNVLKDRNGSISFQWVPFPIEVTGASVMIPSPSGSKLLVVRNLENDSPTQLEIWGQSQLEKEFHVPKSVHGSIYSDGWFEGISWNSDETLIAYVAEEPVPPKPTFNDLGYKKRGSSDKDCRSWKGVGDWEENWGESYAGKRQPALFVINNNSGEIRAVEGIGMSMSVGQVVWAPSTKGLHQYLVFVGWPSESDGRKFGMLYSFNRPCALYAVRAPFQDSEANAHRPEDSITEDVLPMLSLTRGIPSAFSPRFSPDGKFLVFLSAKSSADSGAHCATDSLHRIDWPTDEKQCPKIVDVVRVVMCPEDDDCFPGLYCANILSKPWLSDGHTMILSSIWGSTQAILSVDVLRENVSRISPGNSKFSWNILTRDGDNIVAVCSSPVDVPRIKYGCRDGNAWNWLDISSPGNRCSENVRSLLSSLQFSIMKIPIRDVSENLTKGACKPYEAIFVSSSTKKHDICDPLIVYLHGGPHYVSLSAFSKSLAFLASLGYSLLIVNYRGSLGYGEEALQSLLGKIGFQDVNDVLTAIDYVIDKGLADSSKITVLGGSHGGFLATHLIGQAPDKFVAAATRSPVCNLALMVGTTDDPEFCYVEAIGSGVKSEFMEVPSTEHLAVLHEKSPISHLPKVRTPALFLLGAQDLRVPVSNGLQYARTLKENGVEVKVMMFPNDGHAIDRPQSDFESWLNIGVWFKKHCK